MMSAFEFVVKLLKAWRDGKGELRFEGVAASTSLDRQDERLTSDEKLKQYKQYGLSVGGRVLSAHREFDAEAGKHVKYIDDVELDHIAVCRPSMAVNPDTYLRVLGEAAAAGGGE